MGQQIIVQSETERQLNKQLRKEEKRVMKGRGYFLNESEDVDELRKRY